MAKKELFNNHTKSKEKRIVILGAGPTGLGAAYRLQELGYQNWVIYEQHDYLGGHSASWKDEKGFWWDEAVHVMFSHYEYFNNLVEKLLDGRTYTHQRKVWIRMLNRWIPYPFQNNIRYLPRDAMWECVQGILEASKNTDTRFENFYDMNYKKMGEGISNYFMEPYNLKVWSIHPKEMNYTWIGERVPQVDVKRVLENILLEKDDINWGPNNIFKFPIEGGIGAIYRAFEPYIKDHLHLNKKVTEINTSKKEITFADGETTDYDSLISAMPLDKLVQASDLAKDLESDVAKLEYNSGFAIGIGVKGEIPEDLKEKSWVYFPDLDVIFNRITVFSNFSPSNAPEGHWSILIEVPYSQHRPVNKETIIEQTIEDLKKTKILNKDDDVISEWHLDLEYFYPIPTLKRDEALAKIQPKLMERDIYSRGRYGSWRYEIANMDHCVMQGVEAAGFLVNGEEELTWTGKLKVS
jgi:protoporphyrinogen oxidase